MAEAVLGGAMRAVGSASEPGEEDYVTVVYNDEVKDILWYDKVEKCFGLAFLGANATKS